MVELSDMYALFIPLLMSELGATVVDIGLVYSVAGIFPLGFHIFGGWLSDQFGRLQAISWGNLFRLVTFVVMLLADQWQWMFVMYAFQGIGVGIAGPSYTAYIADSTAEGHRAKVFAVQQNIRNAAFIIKFPLAGWIIAQFGFKTMIAAAGFVFLIGAIVLAALNRKPKVQTVEHQKTQRITRFKKSFGVILAAVLAGGLFTWIFIIDHASDILLTLSNPLQVVYLEEIVGISVEKISYLPTIGAIIGLIVTIPLGIWVDKHGENIGLGLAYLLLAVHIGTPLLARSFLGLIPSAIAHPFMQGLAAPAYKSLISKVVPEGQLGLAYGLTLTSRGVVSLPSPYLGGLLWDRLGARSPFLISTIGCLILSALAFRKLNLPKEEILPPR